jgi:hypothetical protein
MYAPLRSAPVLNRTTLQPLGAVSLKTQNIAKPLLLKEHSYVCVYFAI